MERPTNFHLKGSSDTDVVQRVTSRTARDVGYTPKAVNVFGEKFVSKFEMQLIVVWNFFSCFGYQVGLRGFFFWGGGLFLGGLAFFRGAFALGGFLTVTYGSVASVWGIFEGFF